MTPPTLTHATPGFLSLSPDAQAVSIASFQRQAAAEDDHLYSVPVEEIPGGLPPASLYIFFAQNETGGYTAMLGEEY